MPILFDWTIPPPWLLAELTGGFPCLLADSGLPALTKLLGGAIYFALAVVAAWGTYCVVLAWVRVQTKRFANEEEQWQLIGEVESHIAMKNYEQATAALVGDPRALPQLLSLAIENRQLGMKQVRQLIADRFQRDVLADLEQRLSWVNTVIKSAPMLGLLGTVTGMMGAFAKLAIAENVRPDALAEDISVALITTAIGLIIAIPLVICTNSIQIRISKLESLVDAGLQSFFAFFEDPDPAKKGRGF